MTCLRTAVVPMRLFAIVLVMFPEVSAASVGAQAAKMPATEGDITALVQLDLTTKRRHAAVQTGASSEPGAAVLSSAESGNGTSPEHASLLAVDMPVAAGKAQHQEEQPNFGDLVGSIFGGNLICRAVQPVLRAATSRLGTVDRSLMHLADQLRNSTLAAQRRALAALDRGNQSLSDRLGALEEMVNSTVGRALRLWRNVGGTLEGLATAVSGILDLAGLQDLADRFNATLLTGEVGDLVQSLQDAVDAVAGLESQSEGTASEWCGQLNTTIEAGVSKVNSFARSLTGTAWNLLDGLADRLASRLPPSCEPDVRAPLGNLSATLNRTAARLSGTVRDMASGVGRAQALVGISISPARSAAGAPGAWLAGLLALLAAARTAGDC